MDFLLGGVAAMGAGFFSNPMDVIKTRMQLQGELKIRGTHVVHYKNVFHAMYTIGKNDGILALQKGLMPALGFQVVLNGVRLGLYQSITDLGWTTNSKGEVSVPISIIWGGICGGAGAGAGSPFYLVKTQLQSKACQSIAVGYQHEHKTMTDALKSIYTKHGIKGLWRGVGGTVPRTGVASAAQLSTFTRSKELLRKQSEVFKSHPMFCAFCAGCISGSVTVMCMQPFDVISTRLYNQAVDVNGKGLFYTSLFDCFRKTWHTEGLIGLYKGLGPSYMRTAPHSVLTLVFWEHLKAMRDSYYS